MQRRDRDSGVCDLWSSCPQEKGGKGHRDRAVTRAKQGWGVSLIPKGPWSLESTTVLVPRVISNLWPGCTGGGLQVGQFSRAGATCEPWAANTHRSWGVGALAWKKGCGQHPLRIMFEIHLTVCVAAVRMISLPNNILLYEYIICCQWTFRLFPDLFITNNAALAVLSCIMSGR